MSRLRELRCAGRLERHKVWLGRREFQINMCQVPTSSQQGRNTYRESALICKICKATKYLWSREIVDFKNCEFALGILKLETIAANKRQIYASLVAAERQ